MIVQELLQKGQTKIRQKGIANSAHQMMLKAVNNFMLFKILRGVTLQKVEDKFLDYPSHFKPMFLSEQMLRHYSRDPGNEMPESFIEESLAKGDQCFGIFDGGVLASYGWYSQQPTHIDPPELFLHFNPSFVYMYKGFTHHDYRGQRLHAIGMNLALKHYLEKGYKGLVSYVESSNFDSLKSIYRLGYVNVGSIYLFRLFGRYQSFASSGCDPFELALKTLV
nr:GNAT family N-acetyltransferase [uncultured Pseudomonas sp.]